MNKQELAELYTLLCKAIVLLEDVLPNSSVKDLNAAKKVIAVALLFD